MSTFRLTRDYPEYGLKAGDLCRHGVRPGQLEVYRTVAINPSLVDDLKAGRPRRRPRPSRGARPRRPLDVAA
jgi:hypothetical protein